MSVALVTGGTRRLGAAIAARLARRGCRLALHYRGGDELDAGLSAAIEEAGVDWVCLQADLADEPACDSLVGAAAAHFGAPVDVLVNNASMFGHDRLETASAERMGQYFRVNAAAPALLARAMAAQPGLDRGVIVNMLDQRLVQPHGDNFAYTVSKFALAGLTEVLARTLAPRIRVNAVAPGLVLPTQSYGPAQTERARRAMPLGDLPTPGDVVEAVAYLVGAGSVTGETIHVDAGARHRSFNGDFDAI